MLREVEALAPFEQATILIEGESGTGKSFVARHLHRLSPRSGAPFHQVILSALDDNLAASDLFGHLSGSYTDARHNRAGHFVTASKGTLFLDEIGKATAAVQRKLLQAIEHREITPVGADRPLRIDVRLVAATNIPLETLVERGLFLDDLAARLETFRIRLPALRERREDIPALVKQFIGLRAASCGHPVRPPRISSAVMSELQRADWPRNLRQLDGVVQRLLIASAGTDEIVPAHCRSDLLRRTSAVRLDERYDPEVTRRAFARLKSATKVVRELGMARCTVYRHLRAEVSEQDDDDRAIPSRN